MSTAMSALECQQTLLVQADFDGELDAGQAATLVEHLAQCERCRRVREQLARSRELMRAAPRYAVPAKLRAALRERLQTTSGAPESKQRSVAGPRRWFHRASSLGWGAAIAASAVLATVLFLPRSPDIAEQVVAGHLRAMQLDSHLIDVVSSDHHTVKPWFAGKVNFAPPVKELEPDGYTLKGGRIDIVRGAPAAVLVYQAGRHVIDVYMWLATADAGGAFQPKPMDGFNLRRWEEGGLVVWCVSDMAAEELDRFEEHWRAR